MRSYNGHQRNPQSGLFPPQKALQIYEVQLGCQTSAGLKGAFRRLQHCGIFGRLPVTRL